MLVQAYTSWQPLEEVIVGRVYTPEYFDFIDDEKVRDQIKIILQESCEDLDNLSRMLVQFGARVKRPGLPQLWDFRLNNRNREVPMPPLTPRDWQITLGEKLLRVLNVPEMNAICDEYELNQPGSVIDPHQGGYQADHVMANAVASCIVRVGEDVFFDNSEMMTPAQIEWIRDNILDHRFRVRQAKTNGHGDAVFAILKPGVIISSLHDADINYQELFPGWEVCKVWDPSIWAAMEVGKFKYETFNDRWYVPGHEVSPEFANYVDTYLTQWTGYVKETVFDVNCLVLDEHNVIFSSYNKTVFDFCRKHHIEPHICELRHKYFFDGGISCCTQDIRRRGGLENYF